MHLINREQAELYRAAVDAIESAKAKGYRRGMVDGIAVGLALALMVWALAR